MRLSRFVGLRLKLLLLFARKGQTPSIACQVTNFRHFTTLTPKVNTPVIDMQKTHAVGVDSVELAWSPLVDRMNKSKVIYQVGLCVDSRATQTQSLFFVITCFTCLCCTWLSSS